MFTGASYPSEKTYSKAEMDEEFQKYLNAITNPPDGFDWSKPAHSIEGPDEKTTAFYRKMAKVREFRKRFGIERLIYKNDDMKNALSADKESPLRKQVEAINNAYDLIAWELQPEYEKVFARLIEMGYSNEEAKRRADEYIAPILMAEVKLVKAKHPFALGSGKNKKHPSMTDALYARLKGVSPKGAPIAEEDVGQAIKREFKKEGRGKEKIEQ